MDTDVDAEPDLLTELARFSDMLRHAEVGWTEVETLARITAFEELKATVVAAQARESVAFADLRRARDRANQIPERDCGVRSGEEIGLAKKVSPAAGRKFLTTARAVVTDMPNTLKALNSGEISEDKARIMVEETSVLEPEDRRKVDTRMRGSLGPAGLRSLRAEARALAEEMDARSAAERAEKAAANRRVTMTPIADGMGRVSAILPLPQAVAVFEGLTAAAEAVIAAGGADGRGRRQVLADAFVERLTGQDSAEAVPAEVHIVMEAESLLADGLVPAWLPGFGPLPAKTARNFLAATEAKVLIRRLFTRAADGQLVGMEARGRAFTGQLRQMMLFRDDVCRTPWCDAPIRHADHADPHATGGDTSWENGSGLCAACNYTKEHTGWKHEATAEGLSVTTPSGGTYETVTPPLMKRMRYPRAEGGSRASPREDDWRLQLAGLLEPSRAEPSSPEPDESPPETEVELPYLPLTSAEARDWEEQTAVSAEAVDSAIEACLSQALAEVG
ncbi:MAG: DUF222 domain-containing protein [Brevibacterium sp.]